jgi:single-stranded-DNA-specific exonuclease
VIYDSWSLLPAPADNLHIPIGSATLRGVVIRRGIDSPEAFSRFVTPEIGHLHDPAGIHGMLHACERIERAVKGGETILIYGDYDVDGVTSIVLLQTVLRSLGADAAHVVPHRLFDGYGLKIEVLDRVLAERDVKLVITVDCGITSVEPVQRAIERGIDVIITDHHLPPGTLPEAAAVLNPKQPGCDYPFKELAGVGVAFKLCCELIRRNGKKISIDSLLKIAAIGTIADVAPLTGENRTIVWLGLRGLAEVRNPGLRALLQRLGIYGRPLRASDVGFKIGPRINAAGRLASADTAIELFAATTDEAARELCATLDRMNVERQEVELEVRGAAETEAAAAGPQRVLVLAGEGWHKGVVGLTAGRLAQKFHRPALVLSIEGEQAVGSGRSIRSIDLHSQLERVSDLFTHFGGHELACGFSLPTSRIDELRRRLRENFAELDASLFIRDAEVEGVVTIGDLDGDFVQAHEMLQPFGSGNLQPMFVLQGARVVSTRTFAEDCCEVVLEDGSGRVPAVVWPSVKMLTAELVRLGRSDVLFHLEPDRYSPIGIRLVIADIRATDVREAEARKSE